MNKKNGKKSKEKLPKFNNYLIPLFSPFPSLSFFLPEEGKLRKVTDHSL